MPSIDFGVKEAPVKIKVVIKKCNLTHKSGVLWTSWAVLPRGLYCMIIFLYAEMKKHRRETYFYETEKNNFDTYIVISPLINK